MKHTSRLVLLVAAALAGLLIQSPPRSEASELQRKLSGVAKKIAEYVKSQDQSEVALTDIIGPPEPATSSGPGIQALLREELAKQGVKINQKAALVVEGKYLVLDEDEYKDKAEDLVVRLILYVCNHSGKRLTEVSEDLTFKGDGNVEIVKLLAMQVDLSKKTKASPQAQNRELKKQLQKPPLHLDGRKVKTTKQSKYAVEVFVQPGGKGEFAPAAPKDKGLPFVELKRGDVYKLRLHNADRIEAAASVTIDGVDAFQFFEPTKGRPTSFLIPPAGARDVKGWPRGTESYNEFLVGSYSKSAAAAVLRGSAKLGTITVCFFPCWTGKTPPPEYDDARSGGDSGTGFGKEVREKTDVVRRTFGPLAASVTIRYSK
jgi:hypothetical protein